MQNQILSTGLGYDEVVDTYCDSIEIYRTIREPLADGIDFADILSLYNAYPQAVEVYNDRNTFIDQLTDLTPEEAVLVFDAVAERLGEERDNVERVAIKSLRVANRVYRTGRFVVDESKEILLDVKEIGEYIKPAA